MRALCSVRGPLGGDTRALGAGARLLSLRMPGQPQPLHFVVEAKARVKELKSLANSHAQLQGITDTELFGLAILQNGEYLFVDVESKLSKYAPKSWRSSHTHGLDANGKPLLELHLVVQFHVESPLLLHDKVGRHLYFLQLLHNLRTRDGLPAEIQLLLVGLALQAKFGDAEAYDNQDYFKLEDFAPPSLTGDWVNAAVRACHQEHKGLSKPDAETRFIREICLLPDTINSHRYRLKQSKTESEPGTVWLLVTAKGIKILPDSGSISNFIWSSIGKLSFDRKKFEIRTEQGKITLYSSSEEKCKYLFALCKETHQFSMKISTKLNDILRKEEEERKICYGYSKSLNFQFCQNKNEQRISLISSTSSNTTSGIVSDRVQSEDELEIMIDSPPAPSTESLAFAHLLDCSNSYLIRHLPQDNQPLKKTSSLQMQKAKIRTKKLSKDEEESSSNTEIPLEKSNSSCQDEVISSNDLSFHEALLDSPISGKVKCTGSQCSSSCSTVIMNRAGLSTLSRASNGSSLELSFNHTAQNSLISDNSNVGGIDSEYSQDTASALYDGLGQPVTVAASSETSGVYTMGSSELTSRSKSYTLSEDSRTEYGSAHYDIYKTSKENDLADFDSVSSILNNKSKRSVKTSSTLRLQRSSPNNDCVDGVSTFCNQDIEEKSSIYRERANSNVSAISFHGDGSDPSDNKHNLLSASELSDLIVGRGVYPKNQSVSDTFDSVSDYVRLPLPFSGDSYLQGHEDTAPSEDNYLNNSFFDRPPTPPTRIDSRKSHNLSLPNVLGIDGNGANPLRLLEKPPPPYEYNHKTLSSFITQNIKPPPAYPGITGVSKKKIDMKEEVPARVVTTKPMITILKAEAGEVNTCSERTFASPMVLEHRFQKSKRHQTSSRRAERSKLAQGISNNLSPSREIPLHGVDSNVLVAMMKLPPQPPPPPPRHSRLPPPPPTTRLPPPPPPQNPIFHQQLYSDVDYVYYPLQDPAISQQNYLDHKLTESRISNMNKNSLQYRSTPYLSTSLSASSTYGSIQNLSDSYIQTPGLRTSWYSMTSRTSVSNHSINFERPLLPINFSDISKFSRTKSHENILNVKDPPPIKVRRMPPPPPPPYEYKKKLPTHLRDAKIPNISINSDTTVTKTKDSNCDLDITTLREKSKNLDLPLIAALCNDRSLLKQTKAFGAPKLVKQTGNDCQSELKCAKPVHNTTDNLDRKNIQEFITKKPVPGNQKKIIMRNPTDKLPALPDAGSHTPRAMSNTYVMHPSAVVKNKKIQPNM